MTTTPGPECREPSVHPYAEHDGRVAKHYAHAREKHPHFCDVIDPKWNNENEWKIHVAECLHKRRILIKEAQECRLLHWYTLLDCEIWEVIDALAKDNTAHAVAELYDAIAILLRVVDVLEGRQTLGRPETISGNDAGSKKEATNE